MLFDGLDLPVYYDSLLGKLIVWAETRDLAIRRLRRALNDLLIAGIDTNVPFHLALLDHPDFQAGAFHTGWLESAFTMPAPPEDDGRLEIALFAAAVAASLAGAEPAAASPRAGRTKWLKATREHAIGLRVQSGGGGWRRGIASR
jgi:acetyl-CoA carboxylase biotin carboxylase subunit